MIPAVAKAPAFAPLKVQVSPALNPTIVSSLLSDPTITSIAVKLILSVVRVPTFALVNVHVSPVDGPSNVVVPLPPVTVAILLIPPTTFVPDLPSTFKVTAFEQLLKLNSFVPDPPSIAPVQLPSSLILKVSVPVPPVRLFI